MKFFRWRTMVASSSRRKLPVRHIDSWREEIGGSVSLARSRMFPSVVAVLHVADERTGRFSKRTCVVDGSDIIVTSQSVVRAYLGYLVRRARSRP
jgi:hypothetical protein